LGLVGDFDWERFNQRQSRIATAKGLLKEVRLRKADAGYSAAVDLTGSDLGGSISLGDLAMRPGITSETVERLLPLSAKEQVTSGELEAALADNLYAGYIRAQEVVIRRLKHHDSTPIPEGLDFRTLNGLSHEMVERLERTRPQTFGEARVIPGLTAAALSTLYVAASLQT
jgi:tRNA uridine 5-carboxymethylaminomethyl modification enzyme